MLNVGIWVIGISFLLKVLSSESYFKKTSQVMPIAIAVRLRKIVHSITKNKVLAFNVHIFGHDCLCSSIQLTKVLPNSDDVMQPAGIDQIMYVRTIFSNFREIKCSQKCNQIIFFSLSSSCIVADLVYYFSLFAFSYWQKMATLIIVWINNTGSHGFNEAARPF